MDDDKPNSGVAPQATEVETETTTPAESGNQTIEAKPEGLAPQEPHGDLTAALKEERSRRQQLQREIAEYKARSQQPAYQQQPEEDDLNKVMTHPFVQKLMLDQAKRELTDYSKDLLDKYPTVPEPVKKAILKNVRGFVQETTTDIENAKLDIQEYIESLVETPAIQPQAKSFPVTATNVQEPEAVGKPADIVRILEKPLDEWTADEQKLVEEYKKNMPKK